MRYHHVQRAPLFLIMFAVGVALLIGALATQLWILQVILMVDAIAVFIIAVAFRQLTSSDEGEALLVQFGPLPLFRKRVTYADIESVAPGRTRWLDGWGIHWTPAGGWVWNLWGYDCVKVKFRDGRRLTIGTDDAEGLSQFLSGQLSPTTEGLR